MIWCEGAAQNYMKLFVAHKMTRNNTLNEVRVTETKLYRSCWRSIQNVWRGNRTKSQSRSQTLCSSKVNRKKTKLLEVEGARQGRSQKFVLGGYNFLLHDTTVLYTSSLTASAAISAQSNFQGMILGGYIYRYTPRRYAPGARAPVPHSWWREWTGSLKLQDWRLPKLWTLTETDSR